MEQLETQWSARDVGKGLALLAGLAVLLLATVSAVHRLYPQQAVSTALALTVVLQVTMPVAAWLFGVRKAGTWQALGVCSSRVRFAYTLLPALVLTGILLANSLYTVIVSWAGIDLLRPTIPPVLPHLEGVARLASAIVIVGIAPFTEELFWRGFVLPGLVGRLGVAGATGVSSLLFGLAHLTPGLAIPAFLSGVMLSWLYLKTRSVLPSFIAHSTQNALAFLALG